jgi:Flp pilus assembly pilin Flp
MIRVLQRLLREERGEDLVEYGLLVAFAAGVVTVAIIADPVGLKTALIAAFAKARDALNL